MDYKKELLEKLNQEYKDLELEYNREMNYAIHHLKEPIQLKDKMDEIKNKIYRIETDYNDV